MGAEDFTGSSSGGGLIHPESTIWGVIFVLSFKSVLGDHGSHEDVIGVSGESGWDNSLVLSIEHTVLMGSNEIGLDRGIISELSGGLVWWSSVGLFDGVVTVGFLGCGVLSVVLDRSETPDWLTKILNSLSRSEEQGDISTVFHVLLNDY